MITRKIYFISLGFFILFFACSSPMNVQSDYDHNVDFTQYKTYNFIPQPVDSITGKPLVPYKTQRRLEAGIEYQLQKKGYHYIYTENPDFWISYYVKVNQEERPGNVYVMVAPPYYLYNNPAYNMHYGNQYYSGNPYTGGYYGWAGASVSSYTYTTGALAVDIVDGKTGKLVWYGRAGGEISSNPGDIQKNIDKACGDIFEKFNWTAK